MNTHIDFGYNAYSTFEYIPFLLLENAVKYSPPGNAVNVFFEQDRNKLEDRVNSTGPFCDDTSIVFEKGHRGEGAKKVSDGSGLGLYFVKTLCDIHSIDISVSSSKSDSLEVNNVPYGNFIVSLTFTT